MVQYALAKKVSFMATLTLKKKPAGDSTKTGKSGDRRQPLRGTGVSRTRPTLAQAQTQRAERQAAYEDRRGGESQGQRREGAPGRPGKPGGSFAGKPFRGEGPGAGRDRGDRGDRGGYGAPRGGDRGPGHGGDRGGFRGDDDRRFEGRGDSRGGHRFEGRGDDRGDRRGDSRGDPRGDSRGDSRHEGRGGHGGGYGGGYRGDPRRDPRDARPAQASREGRGGFRLDARFDKRENPRGDFRGAPRGEFRPGDRRDDRRDDRRQDPRDARHEGRHEGRHDNRAPFHADRGPRRDDFRDDRRPYGARPEPGRGPMRDRDDRHPGPDRGRDTASRPDQRRQTALRSHPEQAPRVPQPAPERSNTTEGERLSKRMSELGLASRREADEWIAAGWVKVDGRLASLGERVGPEARIEVDPAAREQQAQRVTILIHKPIGYVSGQAEDGYEPASVLIKSDTHWKDDPSGIKYHIGHTRYLAPAGRLDIDSTGLLVLTQDGRVAEQLIGDDSTIEKEYLVRVEYVGINGVKNESGQLGEDGLALLNHGLTLDDVELKPAKVSWANEDQLRFVLREGRKRQIRRMCELVGLKVTALKRVRIGRIPLGHLPAGQWRFLAPWEKF